MPYRIRKVFELEKSTFRPAALLPSVTEYSREFSVADSRDRTVLVTFETERLCDAALDTAFQDLDSAINYYLDRFSGSTCVSRSDPRLAEYKQGYRRIIVVDGDPSAALLARLTFDHIARLLDDEKFASLHGRVRVTGVLVENGDGSAAEYSD